MISTTVIGSSRMRSKIVTAVSPISRFERKNCLDAEPHRANEARHDHGHDRLDGNALRLLDALAPTAQMLEIGAQPVGSSPAEQDAMLRRQMNQFRPVIRDMKLE